MLEGCEERCLLSSGGVVVVAPLALSPTQTDLEPTPLPVVVGRTAFVTAAVSSAGGTPSGDVVFTVDGVAQTPVALETIAGRQEATFMTSTLAVGPHVVTAAYQGDATFAPSTSATSTTLQIVTVTETNVTARVPAPVGVALSPVDGKFYVAEAGQNRIAIVDPTTLAVTESSPIPTADAAPFGLAVAPDGSVYFTEYLGNKIGKYDPTTDTFTEYAIPTTDSLPWGIAVGNDGAVYFTEFATGTIGVLNPETGLVTDSLPDQYVGGAPSGIVAGPAGDNHVYFVNTQANTVGSFLATRNASGDPTSAAVIQVPLPGDDPTPLGVTIGPDAKVWFTEVNASAVGRWDQSNPDPNTSVTIHDLPAANSVPLGIASGPGDNRLYFTDFSANALGSIDATTGAIAAVPLTAPLAGPFGIATGPGGVWFTETVANQIGRYLVPVVGAEAVQPLAAAPAGLTETPLPNATGGPFGMTVGPDNAVWFTESAGSALGRYDLTTKAVTSVPTLTPNSRPLGITTGPGGLLYFTEATGLIGSYDPATQTQAEYPIPTANSGPLAIVNCPACGNVVFFTESVGNKIGRLDTSTGVVTEYPIPTANCIPYGIAVGPDGKVYFTETNADQIGVFDPADPSVITEYALPADASSPTQIVAAPDGFLYFATVGSQIGKVDPADPSSIAMIPISGGLAGSYGIAVGPADNLYLTGFFSNEIGVFNTTQTSKRLSVPTTLAGLVGVVAAPDGNVYVTEYLGGNLGEVQLVANPAAEATVTTVDPGTPNPSEYGDVVTFVAHIDVAAPVVGRGVGVFQVGAAITGFVTFTVDGVDQTPVAVEGDDVSGFTATFTTSTLKPGSHHVTARYGGDANHDPSQTSAAVTQTVAKVSTTTNLQPGTPNPSAVGQTVTFHVTMLPRAFTGDQPTGSFVLYVDGKAVQAVKVGGTGSGYFATFRYAFPTAGSHRVAALYAGDAEYAASPASTAVMQTVNPPASRGPTVTVVTRYGYHWTPTQIVIGFSTALDPARAQNVSNYVLRLAGSCATIPIVAARYNPATFQVTLIPAKLLPLKNTYVLTVRGAPPTGLTDTSGQYLIGSVTGQPGTNYVTRLTYKNLSWAPAPPVPPVILTAARKLPAGPAARFRR